MKKILTLLCACLLISVTSYAQCTNNASAPSGAFTAVPWAPLCQGTSTGEIRIAGIASSVPTNVNRPFTARILSADGSMVLNTFPIPGNNTTFNFTGLTAGSYKIDIADACGNNSADRTVVIPDMVSPSFTFDNASIIDKKTDVLCGDTYQIRSRFTVVRNSQTITVTLTNNIGQTITTSLALDTVLGWARNGNTSTSNNFPILSDIPATFFNGGPLTISATNSCGETSVNTITIPALGQFSMTASSGTTVSSNIDPCIKGFNRLAGRNYGTNPISAIIKETANPSNPVLDIDGNVIAPFSGNLNYIEPNVLQSTVFSKLKFATQYTIDYTDACGLTYSETFTTAIPTVATVSGSCFIENNNSTNFVDNTAGLRLGLGNQNLNKTPPYTFTINSGPTTWTSALGLNAVSNTLTYPIVFNYPTDNNLQPYNLGQNGNNLDATHFPQGTYNITYADACGHTNTINVAINASCAPATTRTTTFDYCGSAVGTANVTYMLSGGIPAGQRFGLYTAAGVLMQTLITSTIPNQVTFTNVPPGTYYVRFGGVASTGVKVDDVGMPNIPRLIDNYIYEEQVVVAPVFTLAFATATACDGTATGLGTGGTAPYTYTLLNAANTTVITGPQVSGTFMGLTNGINYTLKVTDFCGREFVQSITPVAAPAVPAITQTPLICLAGVVTPATITVDSPIGMQYLYSTDGGTTYLASTTFGSLASGTYTILVKDNVNGCSTPSASIVIDPIAPCIACPILPTVTQADITSCKSVNLLFSVTCAEVSNYCYGSAIYDALTGGGLFLCLLQLQEFTMLGCMTVTAA